MIKQAGGGRPADAAKVKESYRRSKRRLAHTLSEEQTKSSGVLKEHRISLALSHRLRTSLAAIKIKVKVSGRDQAPCAPTI